MVSKINVYYQFLSLVLLMADELVIPLNKKICFHTSEANERGTAATLFDIADFNEKILHHRSHIILPNYNITRANTGGLKKFAYRFDITFYIPNIFRGPIRMKAGGSNLPKHAIEYGCDILVTTKAGTMYSHPAFPVSFSCKLPIAVHSIFNFEKHGWTYATVNPAIGNSQLQYIS